MRTRAISIEDVKTGEVSQAVYEHPFIVRLCHWMNTISLFVMVGSGLQIFRAFPSFGAKIPQKDLLHWPEAFALGGWLGGALQWHLTFMWIYLATGLLYIGYQIFSGNYRQVLFALRDVPGVWPVVRHYFFFGSKPPLQRGLQPIAEMRIHSRDRAGCPICADRIRRLETSPVLLAGMDDGWLSLGKTMAFPHHVGADRVCVRPSDHGDPAWLE